MAIAHMVALDEAENMSFPRISVRFMDTPSTYFIRKTLFCDSAGLSTCSTSAIATCGIWGKSVTTVSVSLFAPMKWA